MALKNCLTGVLSGVNNGQQIISEIEEFSGRFTHVLLDNTGNKSVHFGIHRGSLLVEKQAQITQIVKQMVVDPQYAHLNL